MLKLSKLADYGVVILATMARQQDKMMTATRVAELTTLPVPTVSKLLKRMAKVGLLNATRGAAGGYKLARPANEIPVATIIEAVDGPIKIAGCVGPHPEHCGHEHACAIFGRWEPINIAVNSAFNEVKLTDMIRSEDNALEARFSAPSACASSVG